MHPNAKQRRDLLAHLYEARELKLGHLAPR